MRPVHVSKKTFALAAVVTLTGLLATALGACGAVANDQDGVRNLDTDASADATAERDATRIPESPGPEGPENPPDNFPPPTVGKLCSSKTDCNLGGSASTCSKGGFQIGDIFGSPVCIQATCTQGTGGTIQDLLCDDKAGLCFVPGGSGKSGICFPFCTFTSTAVSNACAGGNKCHYAYAGTDVTTMKPAALGYCIGACSVDADCTGTPGEKCQAEDGFCVNPDKLRTYTAAGSACTRSADGFTSTCNCAYVGNHADGGVSASADKGFCTHACITGSAGDAVCDTASTGWKCTASLPALDEKGIALFDGQPADIAGTCAQPCGVDDDCTALATASALTGLVKCKKYADGKYCAPTAD